MNYLRKIILLWAILLPLPMGCVHHGVSGGGSAALPEEIQIEPRKNAVRRGLNVCIFEFTEPDSAPGMGLAAAESLRRELLKNGVFTMIELKTGDSAKDKSSLIAFAISGRYDLIILGELLYYFDGGNSLASRVDERIEVIAPKGKRLDVLWRARATEVSQPARSGDYIFFRRRGIQARSAATLLRTNASKFCNMIGREG